MDKPNTVKKARKALQPDDVVVNVDFPDQPRKIVKRVEPARMRNYVVVTFFDGGRTSGHGDDLIDVLVRP